MAIVLVGVVVFLFLRGTSEVSVPSPTLTPTSTAKETPMPTTIQVSKTIVTYSDSGYSPLTITVKKGDTVVFENKSSRMVWTASAVHPTHKAYPGSDIAKCGTLSGRDMFDSCKGYEPGESWAFKFNETGTWKYHNHLQPKHTGIIVVE